MRSQKQPIIAGLVSFVVTSLLMLPQVIALQWEQGERIAAHDAALGPDHEEFGRERQARLSHMAYLLQNKPADGSAKITNPYRFETRPSGRADHP
jgi:hypothetical protein